MFRMKSGYLITGVLVSAACCVLSMRHMMPYAFLNIFLMFIAPASYFYPAFFSYIVIALSWALLYPAAVIFYKTDPFSASMPIAIFNLMQLGFVGCRTMSEAERETWDARLREEDSRKALERSELADLNMQEDEIRASEANIVSLYEITKKMSESLKFNEIFAVFSSFLQENFVFKKCDLLIMAQNGPEPRLENFYSVRHGSSSNVPAPVQADAAVYSGLIRSFLEKSKVICISRDSEPEAFGPLGITDESVGTFVGIPIFSEKRVVAILIVENLPREDIDRFFIVAMQFALEIKKVLLYETVEKLAITDSLTGLYTRRYFSERLNEELQRSRRYKFKFAFLMLDIDDFKKCNDTYGHLVGDVVLKELAGIMRSSVREIDLVARYGGEEFAVILPETDTAGACLVAERIRSRTAGRVFKAYDETLHVTISIGVATYPKDADKAKDLIDRADGALYAAKKSGKNLVQEYKKGYNRRNKKNER